MKTLRGIAALGGLLCLVFAGCATYSRTDQNTVGTARIRAVNGSAEVSHGGRSWRPVRVGQTLAATDRARTGTDGDIDFSLGKYGGVLTLMPDSVIEFEQIGPLTPNGKIVAVINLPKGRVVGDTLKLPENARIQIRTPNGNYEIP